MSCCCVLDLRLTPAHITPYRYAYSVLQELGPGQDMQIWSSEDPSLLMEQLQYQMRHALVWSATSDGREWLITIHKRGADELLPLGGTLRRDHETMDLQLVGALRLSGAHNWREAVVEVARLDHALRTHILLENELLAPLASVKAAEATAIMRREHDDIVLQLDVIAEIRESPDDKCQELDTWLGLLAATLNKHEYREESLLFPSWERMIAQRSDRESLLAEVRARLKAVTP